MKMGFSLTEEAGGALGVQGVSFLSEEWQRLGRFLAITGIGPAQICAATQEPGFLIGVLDYLAGDDRLLSAFAAETGSDPADVGKALAALGGHWERDIP